MLLKLVNVSAHLDGKEFVVTVLVTRTGMERIAPSDVTARIMVFVILLTVSVLALLVGLESGVIRSVIRVGLDRTAHKPVIAIWSTPWLVMQPRENVSAMRSGAVFVVKADVR